MRDWLINLPPDLTESDLVDMVEGTLSPEREPIAIAALKAEPRLGVLIKQLRGDRAALGLAGESDFGAQAPSDVADAVLASIDRRVLRELDEVAQLAARDVPVSTLVIREPSGLELFLQSRSARRLALAASVLLAVGAGVYGVLVAFPNLGTARYTSEPLAELPIDDPGRTLTTTTSAQSPTGAAPSPEPAPEPSNALATAGSQTSSEAIVTPTPPALPSDAPDMSLAAIDTAQDHAGDSDAASGAASPAPASEPAPIANAPAQSPELSPAAAAQVARSGRLAIVVRCERLEAGHQAVLTLAERARTEPDSPMSVVIDPVGVQTMPGVVTALLSSPLRVNLNPDFPGQDESADASGGSGASGALGRPSGVAPSPNALAPNRPSNGLMTGETAGAPAGAAAFWATIEPSEAALGALKASLETALGGGQSLGVRVEFRALDQVIEQTISWEPDAILWWQNSSARWGRTARVPVLVEPW